MPEKASTAPRANRFVYSLVRIVCYFVFRVCFRFRCDGLENVPHSSSGRGVILAPNHASYLDPPAVGIALRNCRLTYLAKDYLFRTFFIGWALRQVGTLPIKTRSDDFRSLRELIRLLRHGAYVVVFPEGTRSVDGRLAEPEQGVGFLAVKSGAWVVPVYLRGTREALPRGAKWFRLRPVSVHYGKPFVPCEHARVVGASEPYAAASRLIMDEIQEVGDAVERGTNEFSGAKGQSS